MTSYRKLLLLFALLSVVVACGYREGVIQKEPKSFLWLTGNVDQAVITIDEGQPIILTRYTGTHPEQSVEDFRYYQVSPGKHRITAKKNNEIVVDRILIIGDGDIREIQIP